MLHELAVIRDNPTDATLRAVFPYLYVTHNGTCPCVRYTRVRPPVRAGVHARVYRDRQ